MNKPTILLLLLLTACPGSLRGPAAPQPLFEDLYTGMTRQEVFQLFPGADSQTETFRTTVYGASFEATVNFESDRLSAIEFVLDPEGMTVKAQQSVLDQFVAEFMELYGDKPAWDAHTYRWERRHARVWIKHWVTLGKGFTVTIIVQ